MSRSVASKMIKKHNYFASVCIEMVSIFKKGDYFESIFQSENIKNEFLFNKRQDECIIIMKLYAKLHAL